MESKTETVASRALLTARATPHQWVTANETSGCRTGASILGGMTHVASLKFEGGGNRLKVRLH